MEVVGWWIAGGRLAMWSDHPETQELLSQARQGQTGAVDRACLPLPTPAQQPPLAGAHAWTTVPEPPIFRSYCLPGHECSRCPPSADLVRETLGVVGWWIAGGRVAMWSDHPETQELLSQARQGQTGAVDRSCLPLPCLAQQLLRLGMIAPHGNPASSDPPAHHPQRFSYQVRARRAARALMPGQAV